MGNDSSSRSGVVKAVSVALAAVLSALVLVRSWFRRHGRRHEALQRGAMPPAPAARTQPAATVSGAPSTGSEGEASLPGEAMAAILEGHEPQRGEIQPPREPQMRTRRRLLTALGLAIGGAGAAIVGIPVVGSLIWPLVRQTNDVWRAVGAVSDFAIGTTTSVTFEDADALVWSGVSSNNAAWLRRDSETSFTAFKVNCTHLGCPVRWFQDAKLFMCPCHGGVFYDNGVPAAGPPRQPLHLYSVRVRDGQVEILTGPIPIT